jgi:hypothetical protein
MEATAARTPLEVLGELTSAFLAFTDRGEATRSLELCAEPFEVSMMGKTGGIDLFRSFMEQREKAGHQSRHVVCFPTVTRAGSEAVEGVVPVVAYRLVDGKFSIGVADFDVKVVRDGEQWKVSRWGLRPFTLQTF